VDPETIELGDTPRPGGFRRASRVPAPRALAHMRALLLEAAAGDSALARQGLTAFQEWRFLASLLGSAWADGARRASSAGIRMLRRRLRALGTRPIDVAAAVASPPAPGTWVHLRGTARRMGQGRATSDIWVIRTVNTDNVRLILEEGDDFFLQDQGASEAVCVISAGGYLINGDCLVGGERVSVFGCIDRIADPRAETRSPHGRGALSLAIRSGDELPLLIRLER
jgi:hypothetical protein